MSRQSRKSKWDTPKSTSYNAVAPPSSMQTTASTILTPADSSVSSLEAASAAAAKINAVLASKGKLQLKSPKDKDKSKAVQNDPIFAEIEINDVPLHCRNMLTKRTVQERISRESGAAVSTRGCYMNAEEKRANTTGERSLYLFVQSLSVEKVEKAVHKFLDIVKNITKGTVMAPLVTYKNVPKPAIKSGIGGPGILPSVGNTLQEKVFVGLEHAHPSFNVKEKLEGPGGSFVNHIRTETGASVFLRGRGSGLKERASGRESFENLYLFITHIKQENLQAAKKLCENLVQTIHAEYGKFQAQLMGGPPPQMGVHAVGPPPAMPQFGAGPPPLGALLPSSQAAVVTVGAQTTPLVSTGHPVSSQIGQPMGLQPVSASSVVSMNSPVAYPHLQRFQVATQQPAMLTTSVPVGVPGAVPRQVAVMLQPSQLAGAVGLQQPQQLPSAVQQPQLPAGMVMAPRLATVVSPPGVVPTPQGVLPPQGIPVGVPPPTVTLITHRPSLAPTGVAASAASEIRLATAPMHTSGFGVRSQTGIGEKAVLPPPQVVHLQSPAAPLVQQQPATIPLTSQPQALQTLQQNAPAAVTPGQMQQPPPQLTTQQLLLLRGRQEAIQQVAQQQQVAAQQQAAAAAQQQAAQLQVAQQQAAQAAAQQRAVQLQVAQQQAVQQQVAQQQAAQLQAVAAAQQGPTQQQVAAAQLTLAQHVAQQRLQAAQQQQQQSSPDIQQAAATAQQQQQAAAAAAQQTIVQQIAAAQASAALSPASQHVLIQQAPPQQLQAIPPQSAAEVPQQAPQTSLYQTPPPSQLPPHSQGVQLQRPPAQPPASNTPSSQVPVSQAPASQALVSQVPSSQALISQAPPSSQASSSEQLSVSQAPISQPPSSQPLATHSLAQGGAIGHPFSQGDQAVLGPPLTQSVPSSSVASSTVPTVTMETPGALSEAHHVQQQQQTSQAHFIQTSGVLTQQMAAPPASISQAIASSAQHSGTIAVSTGIPPQTVAGLLPYPPMSGSVTSITDSSPEQLPSLRPRYDDRDRDGRDLLTGSLLRDEDNIYGRRRRFREDFELDDKSPKSMRSSEYERRSPPYSSRGLEEAYGRRRRFQEEAAGDSFSSGYGGFRHRERDERPPRFSEDESDRRLMPPPPPALSSGISPPPKSLLSTSALGRPGIRRTGLGPLDSPPSSPLPFNAAGGTDSDQGEVLSGSFQGSPFDNGRGVPPRMSPDSGIFNTPSLQDNLLGNLIAQPGYSTESHPGHRLGELVSRPLDLSSPVTTDRISLQAEEAARLRAQALSGQPFWMARH